MKQKMIGSVEDIQAQPEKYRRVSETYQYNELIRDLELTEGLYIVLPMSLLSNFFVHYQNGEIYLTDNNFGQEEN